MSDEDRAKLQDAYDSLFDIEWRDSDDDKLIEKALGLIAEVLGIDHEEDEDDEEEADDE